MQQRMSTTRDTRLFLHLSNRLEVLAEQLAGDLRAAGSEPLALQTVVVPSAETARWLSMRLAGHTGIAMGIRYPFLRAVVDEVAAALLGGTRRASAQFGRDAIAWWLYDRLPQFTDHPSFAAVGHYLRDGAVNRRFELARRVASLFDQYQVYRPGMLHEWQADNAVGDWQAHLWRALRADLAGEDSFIDLHAAVLAIDDTQVRAATLPSRLSVFGVNTMPPAFLDVLQKAACGIRIDFYVLSPTAHYWSDLRTGKQRLRAGEAEADTEGNPLANSLGKLNRDLLEQLITREAQQASERFVNAASGSLIERLQDDFCELRDRSREAGHEGLAADDRSIQIHSCHGPMREVEVLHDHLLGLFQDDPSLRTRDVLVMAPDIEAYAPYVRAVFGTPEDDACRIPYSLADQSSRSRYGVVDAFLAVLEIGLSRFEASRVVGILENPRIRSRFGVTDTDLTRIRSWIEECGVVRGLGAAHRGRFGLTASDDFTWARGLATLVFGHAMNGGDTSLYADVLPFADLEGDHLDTLDRFLGVMDFLAEVAAGLQAPRSRPEWSVALGDIVQRLCGTDARLANEMHILQRALAALAETDPLDRAEAVPAAVIVSSLDHRLRETTAAGGFLDGRVTFCSLKPMRAIPARIICLLGMNEDSFPRQGTRLAFDLMANAPRRGDRSPREDDRCLFLEAMLAARQHLYISHTGQSQHGPAKLPPSSVVVELADYLRRGYRLGAATAARLAVEHRLQAFSHHYFLPGPLQGFSRDNARTARRLASGKTALREFFVRPLPEPATEWRRLAPRQLVEFFTHPARRICEWRLGLRIDRDGAGLRMHEPLQPDPLLRYQLQQSLAEILLDTDATTSGVVSGDAAVANPRAAALLEAARARGQLPVGPFGTVARQEIERKVRHFVDALRPQLGDTPAQSVPVHWQHGPWCIEGDIHGIHAGQLCRFRVAKLKAKDQIGAWVEHLLVNLASPGIVTRLTDGDGGTSSIAALTRDEAAALLEDLLAHFWRGMQQPLHFFPEASLAYIASLHGKRGRGTPATALKAARKAWQGDSHWGRAGEGEDPWYSLLFPVAPLDSDFERLAVAILVPLHDRLTEDPT